MTYQDQQDVFQEYSERMGNMILSKTQDYSKDSDALLNFKLVAQIVGITPEQVVLVFAAMKVVRLGNLIGDKKSPNHESIGDNTIDLANYSVLLDMVRSESEIEVY